MIAVTLAVVGCSGEADAPSAKQVAVHGSVVEFGSNTPLADFEVCLKDGMPRACATTAADGEFTLLAPANSDVAFKFVRDDYLPIMVAIHTKEAAIDFAPMAFSVPSQQADAIFGSLGFTWNHEDGLVDVPAPAVDDLTIAVIPQSGDGSFSGAGLLMLANLEPGQVELQASAPSRACAFSDLLWRGSTAGTVRLPIEAGFLTRGISVTCGE